MTTYRNVKAQIAKLEKQASDLFKKEVNAVLEKVRGLIAEYGLTAADLGFAAKVRKAVKATRAKKAAGAKSVGVPMYSDPVSGKTWTGKGKPPNWIVDGLKAGKAKADFLITKTTAAPLAKPKSAKPVKAAKAAKVAKVAKVVKQVKKAGPAAKPAKKVVRKVAAKKPVAKAPAAKSAAAAA